MLPSPPVARDPSSLKVCRSQGPWSSTDKPPLAGLLPFVEDCVCVCVCVCVWKSNIGTLVWFDWLDHLLLSLASGLRCLLVKSQLLWGTHSQMSLFGQTYHYFLRSGIQMSKTPHQKGKPSTASREASFPGSALAIKKFHPQHVFIVSPLLSLNVVLFSPERTQWKYPRIPLQSSQKSWINITFIFNRGRHVS